MKRPISPRKRLYLGTTLIAVTIATLVAFWADLLQTPLRQWSVGTDSDPISELGYWLFVSVGVAATVIVHVVDWIREK